MKRNKNKLDKSKLKEIVIEQNAKIKKLNDQVNALRSQKESLKKLLQKPGRDAHWLDTNLKRVELEVRKLRTVVDNYKTDHKQLEDKIKEIENTIEFNNEKQLSLFELNNFVSN